MQHSNASPPSSEIAGLRAPRSSTYKEHPRHLTFPSIELQLEAHKSVYPYLQIEPVLELIHAGHWSADTLPEGADFWGTIVSNNSGHYLVDAAAATRKLALAQPFNNRTALMPENVHRTSYARSAFARLRELQPYDVHVVAMQLGHTSLGGRSVMQRRSVHLAGEYPLGVREVADMLRITNRLSSPQDLGIDCSADRLDEDLVPCFYFENRAIVLGARSVHEPDFSFAEATWFMPGM